MQGALLDRLQIPMMVPQAQNRSGFGTGFTLSVEAVHGVSTGISAEYRAHTIRTLIAPDTTLADIAMPGHIFPLRARDGGVLERRGQTEASVDIASLAGLTPAGVICEVMREDGTMMRLEELSRFARLHDLPIISVEQLAQYRLRLSQSEGIVPVTAATTDEPAPALVTEIGRSLLPTDEGTFEIVVFRDRQGLEHSALLKGSIGSAKPVNALQSADASLAADAALARGQAEPPLVRLHSECLTGDTFGSLRCDCGAQLRAARQLVQTAGEGAILYLRQEGRGIGLGNKIRAYALQDQGLDTVDANHQLGFPADARTYHVAAAILQALGITRLRLLSNNPEKHHALESLAIDVVERIPLVAGSHEHNELYLKTKADRMGHRF